MIQSSSPQLPEQHTEINAGTLHVFAVGIVNAREYDQVNVTCSRKLIYLKRACARVAIKSLSNC